MSLHCKAALAYGEGSFLLDEIAIQEPQADEVVVKMKFAGLCHTNYDSLKWGKPIVMGHEGAGVGYKTGKDVEGLMPGDSGMLIWATPCRHCFQ